MATPELTQRAPATLLAFVQVARKSYLPTCLSVYLSFTVLKHEPFGARRSEPGKQVNLCERQRAVLSTRHSNQLCAALITPASRARLSSFFGPRRNSISNAAERERETKASHANELAQHAQFSGFRFGPGTPKVEPLLLSFVVPAHSPSEWERRAPDQSNL